MIFILNIYNLEENQKSMIYKLKNKMNTVKKEKKLMQLSFVKAKNRIKKKKSL